MLDNIQDNLIKLIPFFKKKKSITLKDINEGLELLLEIEEFKLSLNGAISKLNIYNTFVEIIKKRFKIEEIIINEVNSKTSKKEEIYGSVKRFDHRKFYLEEYRINAGIYIEIIFYGHSERSLENIINNKKKFKSYLEAMRPILDTKLLTDTLRSSSLKDTMTGLYNRRFLEEFIEKVMQQATRGQGMYSVLMLDIDFFKKVNDTYGHNIGDNVIAEIGKLLQFSIRDADIAVRYGGEEFIVLLYNASEGGTMEIAKKIHNNFSKLSFEVGNGETIRKTLSIGISRFPEDSNDVWRCIKHADDALYKAKETGRNRIIRYGDSNNIK